MKSSYKMAHSVGAVALVLAGAAHAADPVTTGFLDKWSVTGGVIAPAACQAGFECGTALIDSGFMSRLVKDTATGRQYFQTIVTAPDATATQANLDKLGFSDENLVSYSNSNGILDKQRINQTEHVSYSPLAGSHDVVFNNGSVIGTGWAADFVELTQTISDPTITNGDGFQTDFIYKQVGYAGGAQVPYAKGMKITAYVPIVTGAIHDKQDFVLVEKQGDFVTADGTVTLPNRYKELPSDPSTVSLNWSGDTSTGNSNPTKGDRIQALYIGEKLDVAGEQFGYTGYTNFAPAAVPANAGAISTFSLSSTAVDPSWSTALWGDLTTTGAITNPFPAIP